MMAAGYYLLMSNGNNGANMTHTAQGIDTTIASLSNCRLDSNGFARMMLYKTEAAEQARALYAAGSRFAPAMLDAVERLEAAIFAAR